jgi:hypothetical protein
VNEENAHKAVAAGLDIHWLAERVLKGEALATYEAAIAPAWATYQAAQASAFVHAFLLQSKGDV